MKLSIITISYNSSKYIEKCISSILPQLTDEVEHIVVDGSSVDGTQSLLEKVSHDNFTFKSERDNGISDAFNKGVELAKGEFVWFVNSDDWIASNSIKTIISYINSTPDVDIFYGQILSVKNSTYKQVPIAKDRDLNYMMSIYHPATIMRKSKIVELGGFRLKKKVAMDYDLFLRAYINKCRFTYISSVLSYFRHGGVSTEEKRNRFKGYLECFLSNLEYRYYLKKSFKYFMKKVFALHFSFYYQKYRIIKKHYRTSKKNLVTFFNIYFNPTPILSNHLITMMGKWNKFSNEIIFLAPYDTHIKSIQTPHKVLCYKKPITGTIQHPKIVAIYKEGFPVNTYFSMGAKYVIKINDSISEIKIHGSDEQYFFELPMSHVDKLLNILYRTGKEQKFEYVDSFGETVTCDRDGIYDVLWDEKKKSYFVLRPFYLWRNDLPYDELVDLLVRRGALLGS